MRKKRMKKDRDRAPRRAEDDPTVRLLRALAEKGWADLEARGLDPERAKIRDDYLQALRRAR
jgi:hypothetical protein